MTLMVVMLLMICGATFCAFLTGWILGAASARKRAEREYWSPTEKQRAISEALEGGELS